MMAGPASLILISVFGVLTLLGIPLALSITARMTCIGTISSANSPAC